MRPVVKNGYLHAAGGAARCAVVGTWTDYAGRGAEPGASFSCRRGNGAFDRMAGTHPRGSTRSGLGSESCRTFSCGRPGPVLLCLEAIVAGPLELQLRALGRRRKS